MLESSWQGIKFWRLWSQMLGYFAIVGLLRVHCLLGDYYSALKTLDCINVCCGGNVLCNCALTAGSDCRQKGILHCGHTLPHHVVLLPGIRLHDDAALCGRNQNVVKCTAVHHPHQAISYAILPV